MSNHLYDGLFHGRLDDHRTLLQLADGSTRSRADVHRLAARIGSVLHDHGIEVGDRVVAQEGAVLGALADELARFKQPKRVVFADELPRNAMGKVQKNLLREAHSELLGGSA